MWNSSHGRSYRIHDKSRNWFVMYPAIRWGGSSGMRSKEWGERGPADVVRRAFLRHLSLPSIFFMPFFIADAAPGHIVAIIKDCLDQL